MFVKSVTLNAIKSNIIPAFSGNKESGIPIGEGNVEYSHDIFIKNEIEHAKAVIAKEIEESEELFPELKVKVKTIIKSDNYLKECIKKIK